MNKIEEYLNRHIVQRNILQLRVSQQSNQIMIIKKSISRKTLMCRILTSINTHILL
jgi:hypothetical protein